MYGEEDIEEQAKELIAATKGTLKAAIADDEFYSVQAQHLMKVRSAYLTAGFTPDESFQLTIAAASKEGK